MSNIKSCFTSRFPNGSIVEIDYSQLEVIGLAILSKDDTLISDLKSGIDMHCMNAANMFGSDYATVLAAYLTNDADWTAKRKLAKVFSFQLQYGAGAKSMAADQGVSVNLAQNFIAAYYERYPVVKDWQDEMIKSVERSSCPSGKNTLAGYPANMSTINSPTGRRYTFTEYDAPEWKRDKGDPTGFSPTQIKNYPVQGFSTGDLVPLAFALVVHYLIVNDLLDRIVPINTIHDSLLFDIDNINDSEIKRHLGNLINILESIDTKAEELWPAINFCIPLTVGIEYGPNWGDMKPFNKASLPR